jgi:hypothetical protein
MAQSDYRPGYIITLANDTVYGKIDYRSDAIMSRECRFESQEGVKTNLYPADITAYRFINSRYYVSREVKGQKYFLEFLIKGKMNIYYHGEGIDSHYYLEKEDKEFREILYTDEIRMKDGKEYHYRSFFHYGLLNVYSEDAPQLKDKIKKIQTPSHENLIKLAKDYHYIVCKDEECVIFEQPIPSFKLQVEPAWGFYFGNKLLPFPVNFSSYGLRIYLQQPRLNERLSFKTGIFFQDIKDKGEKYSFLKVPLQLEYIFSTGAIRPFFAGGTSLYIPEEDGLLSIANYSVGLRIVPKNSKFSFSFNYEIETMHEDWPSFIIPGPIVAGQFISAGANYTF